MSDVRFSCPLCGQMFAGSSDDIGATVNCPSCGRPFTLEAVGEAPKKLPNAFQWYLGIFKKYVVFKSRSRRREFWWVLLIHVCIGIVMRVIDGLVFDEYDDWKNLFFLLYSLATALPLLALQVRRLHDTNKSGWWVLLVSVPVVNIAYLVWLATKGDVGSNRFGADPKGR